MDQRITDLSRDSDDDDDIIWDENYQPPLGLKLDPPKLDLTRKRVPVPSKDVRKPGIVSRFYQLLEKVMKDEWLRIEGQRNDLTGEIRLSFNDGRLLLLRGSRGELGIVLFDTYLFSDKNGQWKVHYDPVNVNPNRDPDTASDLSASAAIEAIQVQRNRGSVMKHRGFNALALSRTPMRPTTTPSRPDPLLSILHQILNLADLERHNGLLWGNLT